MIGEYYKMSNRDIEPFDWYRNFSRGNRRGMRGFFDRDFFREFDDMEQEMKNMFNIFNNIKDKAPTELVREYNTPEGNKVKEIGPIVYGYSMTIGPDGKPKVVEFGNVKSLNKNKYPAFEASDTASQISAEREPLADVNTTDKEVKIILEIPGVQKENISINAYENKVEIIADDPKRKYHKIIDLPSAEVDLDSAKSNYNNGILEVIFNRKTHSKPQGRQIKVE